MQLERHISESAFLVNESRARDVGLSRDRFAHLWVSDRTRKLWEDFSREVYPHDAVELGVRNRYFLQRLNAAVTDGGIVVFVNIGSGFTSYPYLTDRPCRCIEVDYDHVLRYKREQTHAWREEGLLPDRPVEYLPADLNDPGDLARLGAHLEEILRAGPSFMLLEGITYYLGMPRLMELFDLASRVQERGSILAFDFWKPDVASHPITLRFKRFFDERFGHREAAYNLFDEAFVHTIPGYAVAEMTDVQEQERALAGSAVLSDSGGILPEHYAILKKGQD
jgi:O-methyltransferase involved in polyketide biosynthesis